MKKHFSNIILIVIFFVGLSLLLYPSLSNYWNSFHQTKAINNYVDAVADLNKEDYEAIWQRAVEYNAALGRREYRFQSAGVNEDNYNDILNLDGTGIMGYVEIEKLGVSLPIYHGTSDAVLQVAVGHIEGSSLPIGGKGTHSAISGHRGLPSAKLFTDLNEMAEGDTFVIRVLDEVLTYEVDQILIVEPQDMTPLDLVEGEDYCTLVTCTPYGINTHRILVRGHRIDNLESADNVRVVADAVQVEPVLVAPVIAMPILLILLIVLLVKTGKKKK